MKIDHRIARGEWYRMFTSLFMHGSAPHLLMNSWSLFNIGPNVEGLFGARTYALIYLGSGLLANGATFLAGTAPYSLGASGCTFGLLGALAAFYYFNKPVLGQRAEQALQGIKRNIFINMLYGFGLPNIDHWAHAFGFSG